MANERLVLMLTNHGAATWNRWRAQNPGVIDLTEADFQNVDLRSTNLEGVNLTNAILNAAILYQANMTGANLRGARLVNTQLNGADLTGADLTGANFAGAKLNGAVFTRAKLSDTDFTNADIENATFSDAILTPGTKGLKGLSEEQSSEIQFVLEDDEADKSSEDTNPQDASNTADVSITRATSIVGPASAILEVLPIPNDPNFTAEHHDLLRTLQRIVNELNIELGKVEDQNRRLTEEPEVLRMVEESLPVWRQTWLTFIGSAAGSLAGQGSAFATGYTVGFIAGVLHDSFSPSADCLI